MNECALGTIGSSLASYISKLKLWITFCAFVGSASIGPSEATVLRFVALFRNGRSAAGYVTAVRWLHDWARVPITAWDTRSLAQVLRGAVKLSDPVHKAPAITWPIVRLLVRRATTDGDPDFALMCVFASAFLLRVPDELLPMCFSDLGRHSALTVENPHGATPSLRLELRSRKNLPGGAVLLRGCLCPRDPVMCAPHAFMRWLARSRLPPRGPLFRMSATSFSRILRIYLQRVGVADAASYSSHGFRRGTAQAMLARDAPLRDILAAGNWRSAAFLEYLDREAIDERAVLNLLCADEAQEGLASPQPPPTKKPRGGVPFAHKPIESFFPAP